MRARCQGPVVRCATCGAEKSPCSVGDYGDGRPRCLQRDGKGGICWKERHLGATASGSAFAEAAP